MHITQAWQRFVAGGDFDLTDLRPEVAASWRRCREWGVDPWQQGSRLQLNETELADLRRRNHNLLQISQPIMENLNQFVSGTGFLVILADAQGVIMEMIGDAETWANAGRINLLPGSSWREADAGTNGIGTALAELRPVQINGQEHYCHDVQSWTCSACPLVDEEGTIYGVLQMSGASHATHRHTLGMVAAAAQAVEEQVRVQQKTRELVMANSRLGSIVGNMSDGVIMLDPTGCSTHVNPAAERALNCTAAEILNRDIRQTLHGKCSLQVGELLSNGKNFADVEILLESDNLYNCCLLSGRAVRDEAGKVGGGVLIIKSLNKIKNLVNRLSGAQANLHFSDILGQSPQIQEAIRIAKLAADSDSNVLLQGESGTGKEIFAQAIHNMSMRKNGPFVALNCGAIPRELIGSELFGYVEGAFTGAKRGGRPGKFELASGGTLFLDEIGDMNIGKQASLLRAIQERKIVRIGGDKVIPVDVRIISASNKNLPAQAEQGTFRQDLFYRLNVISITLPPLRNRVEDIRLLFSVFLHQESQRMGKVIDKIDPELLASLEKYAWPGNIRELQNVAERMACIAENGCLDVEDLPLEIRQIQQVHQEKGNEPRTNSARISVQAERQKKRHLSSAADRDELLHKLVACGGNISQVAAELGVSRNTVYRKIHAYQIEI